MIKVYQTTTGKKGNCFAASIASILELELKDVPDLLPYDDMQDDDQIELLNQ